MDLKELAIESTKLAVTVISTTVTAYVGIKIAQKLLGPIEVTIKEKK